MTASHTTPETLAVQRDLDARLPPGWTTTFVHEQTSDVTCDFHGNPTPRWRVGIADPFRNTVGFDTIVQGGRAVAPFVDKVAAFAQAQHTAWEALREAIKSSYLSTW